LSASSAEVNDNSLRAERAAALSAGLFDSLETAIDSTTPAPPCSFDVWHDIDDFPETAPRLRLAEQGASMSNSIHPDTPSSRLSSESLYDSISTEGSRHARSEATTSSSSPPPRYCRESPETQLSQEGRLYTGRGVADEHGLADPALDTSPIGEGEREQEVEQEKDEGNGEDEDDEPQQEVNGVAPAVMAERVGGSLRPANGQQSLPNLDPSPELSHKEAGSRNHCDSDDELNSTDLAEDDEKKPRPAKRKQPSPSHDGLTRKKCRRRLQQSSSGQRKSLFDRLSGAALPMLTEIIFRPHSPHCYSFTAVIRDSCAERGVSFSQVVQLIATIGHVGKIDDFTIKPMEQYSFLLTGFSRHTSSQSSPGGGTIYRNTTRTQPQEGRVVDAGALASRRSKPSISDDNGGLSDSDSESSSDDNGYSSGDEQGRSSTIKHSRWDEIDEQRLLAYKKEDKSWNWIFKKFPGRTPVAVRTRWTMVQRKVK
jgi:hypothetical protein